MQNLASRRKATVRRMKAISRQFLPPEVQHIMALSYLSNSYTKQIFNEVCICVQQLE